LLERQLPGINTLRDISLAKFNQLAPLLPERIEKRARHVVEEIQRTIQAIPLLESGDLTRFGELVDQSHVSLRDLFEVSTPELNLMVSLAQQLPGCLGARLTGAGFGGCTINIVNSAQAQPFVGSLAKNYHSATGIEPEIYVCRPAPGAGLAR
jgi:galactokinase